MWAIPKAPKAANLIFESVDKAGVPMWFMPPSPVGNPYEMLAAFDLTRDPDRFLRREPRSIMGLVPDGQALLDTNFRRNSAFGFRDWKELWGREEGKTCLLLSCGPSMRQSRSEAFLERSRPGFFTLALNKSIALGDVDYYYAMDRRGDESWYVGKRPETTLLATTTVNRHAVANEYKDTYWGEHFIASEPAKISPIGTHMAISLCDAMFAAYKLGAKEIWLYGCDFALVGQGPITKELRQKGIQYYFNESAERGLSIRPHKTVYPVRGINDKLVYITWELVCYAAYCTTMAMILTRGGVTVRNKTPVGILWETWNDGKHDVRRPLRLCAEEVPQQVG